MAEHADGTIIIDTEINAQRFKAGSSELQSAIKSLNTKIQSLGPIFQKALTGNSSAVSAFDAKASALESTISEIEAKMRSLGKTQVPTDDYQWLTDEIRKVNNELDRLYARQAKMEALGVEENSRAWQSLQYDIDLAIEKISEYKTAQADMRSNGTAFQLGADTAKYKQFEAALESAKIKLAQMRSEASSTSSATSKLASTGNAVKKAFAAIGAVGKKAFSKISSLIKGGITKMRLFTKHSNRASSSINTLNGKIKIMSRMLMQMLVMRAFMGVLAAIGDGLENLSQYSTQTNKDLSALKSALTQLKNSLATAFAPILTVVTPILTTLINYLAMAVTYVGMFVAAITGAKTFIRAIGVQEDFAASLGATGSAAKKAQKQLAGFDELNILSNRSSGGTPSPSEMFEDVPIDLQILNFVDRLKEAFENGDYAGIGEIIGNGINAAVQRINEFINWDNVSQKIIEGIKAVAQCFNAIVDTVDWALIGDTIAEGFNTVINTIYLVITEFDWLGLAAGLTTSINDFIDTVDWAALGRTISDGFLGALNFIRTALKTFDWQALGRAVATLVANIDWSELFDTVLSIVSEIFDGVIEFRNTLHSELPEDLSNILKLVETIGLTIAAWKISKTLLNGISSILKLPASITIGVTLAITGISIEAKGIADAIQNELSGFNFAEIVSGGLIGTGGIALLGSGIASWITKAFASSSVSNALATAATNLGVGTAGAAGAALSAGIGGIILGLPAMFTGIYDACTNEINWLNATLTALGATAAGAGIGTIIGSCFGPAGTGIGALIGFVVGLVIDGIILIVQEWDAITEFLSNFFTVTVPGVWNSFVGWLENIPSALGEFFGALPDKISTWFSDMWQPIKDYDWAGLGYSIGAWFGEAVKSAVDFVTVTVPTWLSELWDNIVSAFTTFFTVTLPEFFTETLPTAFNKVIKYVKGLPKMLWDAIESGWNWFVDIGEAIVDGIWEGLQTAWQAITDFVDGFVEGFLDALGIHSPSRLFRDKVGLNIGLGIGAGIEASESSVVKTVTGLADAIAEEANAGEYNISGFVSAAEIDNTLTVFSDKVANSFDNLLKRLQAIADGVTFAVPAMATGTIVPYSVSASTAGGNSVTGAFEASNAELGSVIIQAVTNATTAIVAAIEQNSGTVVNLDASSIATSTIKEINRRTQAMGQSPILI